MELKLQRKMWKTGKSLTTAWCVWNTTQDNIALLHSAGSTPSFFSFHILIGTHLSTLSSSLFKAHLLSYILCSKLQPHVLVDSVRPSASWGLHSFIIDILIPPFCRGETRALKMHPIMRSWHVSPGNLRSGSVLVIRLVINPQS